MAFATGEDLVTKCDRRDIANLCTDNDDSPVDPVGVHQHPKALAALESATGLILSAALIADKYQQTDLQSLADAGDAFIVGLTCWLAHGELLGARGVQRERVPPYVERAENWVAALRLGEKIFNIADNRDKGNPQTETASVSTLETSGIAVAKAYGRFFPWPSGEDGGRRRDRW